MQVTEVSLELPLDKASGGPKGRVCLRQGDARTTRVEVRVTGSAGGQPADLGGCSVYLVGTRPDGAYCEQPMEVGADSVCTCLLDGAWAGAAGTMRRVYVLMRQDGGEVGSSAEFELEVLPRADVPADPADTVASRVDKALEDVGAATEASLEAAEKALEVAGRAATSADRCEQFMASFSVGWDDLTDDARAKVAACAAAGAEAATEADVDAAWEEVVQPAIAGGAPADDLTPEEYAWALDIIIAKG